MSRSQLPLLAGALALGAFVTFLFLNRRTDPAPEPEAVPEVAVATPAPAVPEADPMPEVVEEEVDTAQDPLTALENAGVGVRSADPARLLGDIGEALETGDLAGAARLIGDGALTPESRQRLAALAAGGIRLRRPDPAREVGELELNARSRWALHLEGSEPGRDRIFFDLARRDGTWGIEQIDLPPAPGSPVPRARIVDSLGIADAFLQAALRQEFELAKAFVDTRQISDAKIAGLCILFEEGGYRLRPRKPLRAMIQKENLAGYLAHVEAGDGTAAAQFSIKLDRSPDEGRWRLSEVNLDQLLADYARRVAGGDVYYTPLVKNPQGGDTLVLYFDFDADGLSPRTARQLEIVAELLMTDPEKKLTISGHTDALGTEDYNQGLSARRAASVKQHLVAAGVAEAQIITVARGQTQPRRPNVTESGEDNPRGRRANRRTEIYLDF